MMFLADLGRAVLTALIPISVCTRRPDDGRHPPRGRPDERLPRVLPGRLHGVRAGPRRPVADRPRELVLRGDLLVGYIIGPAIAGLLAATIGPGLTLAIDAVSFALSASPSRSSGATCGRPVDRPPASLVADIREGIDYIVGQPDAARPRSRSGARLSIITAPLVTALDRPHHARTSATSRAILGLVLAAYGIGTVVGALLSARADRPRAASRRVLLGGTFTMGCRAARAGRHRPGPGPAGRRGRGRRSPSRWCW